MGAASRAFKTSPETRSLLNDASRDVISPHVDKTLTGCMPETWKFKRSTQALSFDFNRT